MKNVAPVNICHPVPVRGDTNRGNIHRATNRCGRGSETVAVQLKKVRRPLMLITADAIRGLKRSFNANPERVEQRFSSTLYRVDDRMLPSRRFHLRLGTLKPLGLLSEVKTENLKIKLTDIMSPSPGFMSYHSSPGSYRRYRPGSCPHEPEQ